MRTLTNNALFISAAVILCLAATTLSASDGTANNKAAAPPRVHAPASSQVFSALESTAPAEQMVLPSPELKFPESVDRGCDVILLMDSSGSMKTTDPSGYRKAAAKLFISLLGNDDRVGVYSFGDSAVQLIPLTEDTEQNRPALFAAVERISSHEFSTNIAEAVRKGFAELRTSPRRQKFLIMLSDGKLALGSPEKDSAALAELNGVLPEIDRAKIRLHAVAFTDEADRVLLERMARETGGIFRFAQTDREVHEMFATIFEKIKAPDAVPLEGDSFRIDKDVTEATVLISKMRGATVALVAPAGVQSSAARHDASVNWHTSAVFDLITIEHPATGTWWVKTDANQYGRIYILTDLRLKSSDDESKVPRGSTALIDVWLEQRGIVVSEEELLATMSVSADVTGPDGIVSHLRLTRTGKSGEAASGRFTGSFVASLTGDYAVRILAHGKTFTRVRSLRMQVIEPAPALPAGQEKTLPHDTSVLPADESSRQEDVSWGALLVKFGLINLAVVGVLAAGIGIRLLLIKTRSAR